jgi:hypothetical protein
MDDFALPFSVLGPVDFFALRRLAAIRAFVAMELHLLEQTKLAAD